MPASDSDFVVKLIDVYPEAALALRVDAEHAGPQPGQYAQSLNGYELPIAMEVRRGRYNNSYEHPQPLVANRPTEFAIPLRSHDHVFLKGHRLMLWVQSTWFPLIDHNPQTFRASIYAAKRPRTSSRATQRIYTSREHPSHIVLAGSSLTRFRERRSVLRDPEVVALRGRRIRSSAGG